MVRLLSPIIPAVAAKEISGDPDVICVDARGGADAADRYKAGHVSGAVFVDLESELSAKGPDPAKGGRHPLPSPHDFGILLGKSGIRPSTHVLVYDDKSGANAAARFWWMLRAAGHRSVQVVDGGYEALVAAGILTAAGESHGHTQMAPPYPLRDWMLPVADLETVERAGAENQLVIDVREGYRYRGESEPIDEIAGHIPGAVSAPYLNNLQPDGRFRSPEDLRKQYEEILGSHPPKDVIVHCGSGVTACHTLLALEYAGMGGARLYPGSWSEWSRNHKPIARGANP